MSLPYSSHPQQTISTPTLLSNSISLSDEYTHLLPPTLPSPPISPPFAHPNHSPSWYAGCCLDLAEFQQDWTSIQMNSSAQEFNPAYIPLEYASQLPLPSPSLCHSNPHTDPSIYSSPSMFDPAFPSMYESTLMATVTPSSEFPPINRPLSRLQNVSSSKFPIKSDHRIEQRNYLCTQPGCGKRFKRAEHLKRHVRCIHNHDRPFTCPYPSCQKPFSRSDNLTQHIKIHQRTERKQSQEHPELTYVPQNHEQYHHSSVELSQLN